MNDDVFPITRRDLLQASVAAMLADLPPAAAVGDEKNSREWPQFQGGPGHAGFSTDESVKPPFKLVWSYRLDADASEDGGGGVTVGGRLVFISVKHTRSLVALDADTGELRWEYADSYPGYRDVPSYADGRLLLWERTSKPRVLVLEAATGKAIWQYLLKDKEHLPVHTRAGLPVEQGRVYVCEGGEEPAVLALDLKTGREAWRVGLGKEGGPHVTPPSLARGMLFVATRHEANRRAAPPMKSGAVIALNPANGKERWRRKDVVPSPRPLVTDGEVIACAFWVERQYQFHLLDAKTGKTRWSSPIRLGVAWPPTATLGPDHVLLKPYGGQFHVLDRKTGKQLGYFTDRSNSGCSTPVIAGGHAYLGTGIFAIGDRENLASFQLVDAPPERGRGTSLHAVDLQTAKSVWFFGTGNCICGDPAVAYGRLYFNSRDGKVYCFTPAKDGEPATPSARDTSLAASPEQVRKLLATGQPPVTGWPMAGGGPDRAGVPGLVLKSPLNPAWKFATGGRVHCGAVLVNGRVFVGSDAGSIVALDAAAGKLLWKYAAGAPVRCTPAVAGKTVYCGSDSGTFHALDAATGKEKWRFHCGGPVQASPAVVGGVVLFGAHDHHVYALDAETGKKLWAFRLRDYCIHAPPVVHGGQVFAGQWRDYLWAIDLHTGKEQWRGFIPISIEAVAFARDRVYARSPYYVVEMDPATGKRLRIGLASYGYGGLAFRKDMLFQSGILGQYGSSGATATDLAQVGLEIKQKIPTLEGARWLKAKGLPGAPNLASMVAPLVLGETVCFAGRTGKLTVTNPEGKPLWSAQLGGQCHGAPAAADGLLVVGCDDGNVYAFRGA